jgi:hypothetical protein
MYGLQLTALIPHHEDELGEWGGKNSIYIIPFHITGERVSSTNG